MRILLTIIVSTELFDQVLRVEHKKKLLKKTKEEYHVNIAISTINYIFSIFYYKVAVIKKYTNSNDSQLEDATNEN